MTEDKEGIEEMELAATNNNSLESWLSIIEVSLLDSLVALGSCGRHTHHGFYLHLCVSMEFVLR